MIPCEECLLIPVCRFKDYYHLLEGCETLRTMLYFEGKYNATLRESSFNKDVLRVEELMKPPLWEADQSNVSGMITIRVKNVPHTVYNHDAMRDMSKTGDMQT